MKEKAPVYFEFPDSEGINFYAIFSFIWHYRRKIFGFALVSVLVIGLFMLITWLLPAQLSPLPDLYKADSQLGFNYSAYSDLLTNISPASFNANYLNQSAAGYLVSNYSYGEYIKKLIQTNTILDKLIAEFNLKSRYRINQAKTGLARAELKKHLTLDFDEKSLILTISFEDYDPDFAAQFINRLVEVLNARVLELKASHSSVQKVLLEEKLTDVKKGVDKIEAEIKAFQAQYGFFEVESLSNEKINLLASLRSQLILKEIEIRSYASTTQIEDAYLKRLRTEHANLQKIIAEIEAGSKTLAADLPSQRLMSEIIFTANNLQRAYQISKKIYELLLQECEILKLRLSLAGEEPTFQIIEKASAPDTKSSPSRLAITIIVWLICNLGWFTILLIRNWWKIKSTTFKTLAKGTSLK